MKLSLGRQYWRALIDVRQAVRVFALAIVLSTTPGCGGGCPKPQVTNQQRSIWERQLAQRQLMPLEQGHSVLSVSSPPLSPRPLDIDVGATLVVALLVVALGRHKACPYDVGTAPGVGPEN